MDEDHENEDTDDGTDVVRDCADAVGVNYISTAPGS